MDMVKGEFESSVALRKRVRAVADDSFGAQLPVRVEELPPLPAGWTYDLSTLTALRLKGNCDPHADMYVGDRDDIVEHHSLFWLLEDSSRRRSSVMAGGEAAPMLPDDWVFFDDAKIHALLADGTWMGLAIQAYR